MSTIVNLFSTTIPLKDSHSNTWWPCDEMTYSKRTIHPDSKANVVTDELCFHQLLLSQVMTYSKLPLIGWLIEPPVIKPHCYYTDNWEKFEEYYDYVFTYDEKLIARNPDKFKLLPFGAVWISPENCMIYPKNKVVEGVVHGGLPVSMVASNKKYAPGHILRHEIMGQNWNVGANPSKWIDFYGTGSAEAFTGKGEFPHTKEGRLLPFKDYPFSIVIENCQMKNYFTDKLLDCFACGTVPIYWGAPNINEYFKDVITFNTIEELEQILTHLPDYNSIDKEYNFDRAIEFASPDQNLFHALEPLGIFI